MADEKLVTTRQQIDVSAFKPHGARLSHGLEKRELARSERRDRRAGPGAQARAAMAPVSFVYAAHLARPRVANAMERRRVAFAHVGFIARDGRFHGASRDLAVAVRGRSDTAAVRRAFARRRRQSVILARSWGTPSNAGAFR